MGGTRKWPLLQAHADVVRLMRGRGVRAGRAPPHSRPQPLIPFDLGPARLTTRSLPLKIRLSPPAPAGGEAPRAGVARELQ